MQENLTAPPHNPIPALESRPTVPIDLGPYLQNILRQSYDYLTMMPKFLQSTYDGRLICKTSYEECKASLR